MKFYYLIIALSLLLIASCNQEETTKSEGNNPTIQEKYFTAVVINTADGNCKLPVVNFIGDTSGIHSIFYDKDTNKVDYEYSLSRIAFGVFIVKDFPDSLKIKDQIIKITFRKPYKNIDSNEIPFCKTIGPFYPVIIPLSCQKVSDN
ncbi:MAG: hypothetical protein V1779_05170 [bacterium]